RDHPRLAIVIHAATASALGYMTHRLQLLWYPEQFLLLHISLWWVCTTPCLLYTWTKYVSEGRLQKARDLLAERQRRNLPGRLFDCLQLADKGQIVARDEQVRRHTIFASRGQAEEVVKMLERLRNNLAHMQDIVTTDWEAIVRLCE